MYACCEDRAEAHNLVAANPAVAQMLKGDLQREVAGAEESPQLSNANALPQSKRKREADREKMNDYLKALGYVSN